MRESTPLAAVYTHTLTLGVAFKICFTWLCPPTVTMYFLRLDNKECTDAPITQVGRPNLLKQANFANFVCTRCGDDVIL